MPFPLALIPLIAAGASAAAKGIASAVSKDANDYRNEQQRSDLPFDPSRYSPDQTKTYTRIDPSTDKAYTFIDRGNNADRFSALSDQNSDAYANFNLGGSKEAANNIARGFLDNAENSRNIRSAQVDYTQDNQLANQQMGLLGAYRAQMDGQSPSAAQLQTSYGLQNNLRNMAVANRTAGLTGQRAAILGGANTASGIAAQGANARMGESMGAAAKMGGLQGSMSQLGMERALSQAKLDSQMADYGDQLANRYYGMQQSAIDAQTRGQRERAQAILGADAARKSEVAGSAELAANRHNRDVNTVLGFATGGLSALASAASNSK